MSQQSAGRNRLGQTRDPDTCEIIEQAITFYKNQLKVIDQKIAQTIQACPLMQRKPELLASCTGVGVVTVAMLLAELPELG